MRYAADLIVSAIREEQGERPQRHRRVRERGAEGTGWRKKCGKTSKRAPSETTVKFLRLIKLRDLDEIVKHCERNYLHWSREVIPGKLIESPLRRRPECALMVLSAVVPTKRIITIVPRTYRVLKIILYLTFREIQMVSLY
ncbi:hypothetical protein GWI33_017804 [Rhynchophorus ferrugineus]|uniref:Uncharacterized protein n=1 Tax=Rhynchophorus ferrugineus TaxID=354439 RepID=A0A834HXK0_RHYFE|nr:hypothetical protein GWI33_017804 [Rhynchophorus ferrugineus]